MVYGARTMVEVVSSFSLSALLLSNPRLVIEGIDILLDMISAKNDVRVFHA